MKNPILTQKPKEEDQENEPKPNPLFIGCEQVLEKGRPEDLKNFNLSFEERIKELNAHYYSSKSQLQKDLLKFDVNPELEAEEYLRNGRSSATPIKTQGTFIPVKIPIDKPSLNFNQKKQKTIHNYIEHLEDMYENMIYKPYWNKVFYPSRIL